jgi:hypothetical protein
MCSSQSFLKSKAENDVTISLVSAALLLPDVVLSAVGPVAKFMLKSEKRYVQKE